MKKIVSKVSIIGCGTWPTTIAKVLAENGFEVLVWCHRQEIVDDINVHHQHSKVLPGVVLPNALKASLDFEEVLSNTSAVVIGLASTYLDQIKVMAKFPITVPILSLTKGLLPHPHIRVSCYLEEMFPNSKLAVLSGPNLAKEIALQKPSATVIASKDHHTSIFFQNMISNPYFRVYSSNDVAGVELGGVLKNIMAIAAGASDGLGLGSNAKAALITRGLQEMVRFSTCFGAKADTLYGLSGLGDLIATCDSVQSRNYRVGLGLAEGKSLDTILKTLGQHAEGINTTKEVMAYADMHQVDMPVTRAVYHVLFSSMTAQEALVSLMKRELKQE